MWPRKKHIIPWMGIIIFFTAQSCAILFPDRTAPKSSSYQVTPPNSPWHKILVGEDPNSIDALKADLAYENPQTGGIISLNSLCRKYSDHNLESLTNNLVRGIEDRDIKSQQKISLSGSEALDTLFSGTVDKVPLIIRTVVLAKKNCTYDFIHVYLPQKEANNNEAFEKFLSSFRVE